MTEDELVNATMAYSLVRDRMNDSHGNFTQKRGSKFESIDDPVARILRKFVGEILRDALLFDDLSSDVGKPGWKTRFADNTGKQLLTFFLEARVERYAQEVIVLLPHREEWRSYIKYDFCKLANVAGQTARMIAYGFDPDLLRLDRDEADVEMEEKAHQFQRAGVPTIPVAVGGRKPSN